MNYICVQRGRQLTSLPEPDAADWMIRCVRSDSRIMIVPVLKLGKRPESFDQCRDSRSDAPHSRRLTSYLGPLASNPALPYCSSHKV
jgi:DNA-directed RNA polymerase subunit RPC12/RpoP